MMKEFFSSVPSVLYEGSASSNPMAFHQYNPDEVILGKSMREHLRFALSYWHTMCGDGTDMFGRGTFVKCDRSHGDLPKQGVRRF